MDPRSTIHFYTCGVDNMSTWDSQDLVLKSNHLVAVVEGVNITFVKMLEKKFTYTKNCFPGITVLPLGKSIAFYVSLY